MGNLLTSKENEIDHEYLQKKRKEEQTLNYVNENFPPFDETETHDILPILRLFRDACYKFEQDGNKYEFLLVLHTIDKLYPQIRSNKLISSFIVEVTEKDLKNSKKYSYEFFLIESVKRRFISDYDVFHKNNSRKKELEKIKKYDKKQKKNNLYTEDI